eukprot:NODE_849_length_1596_cov_83.544588_g839_i0.p1 GENE.NODE_849_length_1596_cov_83.544588_g839_i0~~NODE_849_length_1596_cov_83.544588_g839_i0.p1  ORF type:complete len:465 (+),score=113.30 NODE_849_length_1596_cov_83.544588_g839_i0:126-1520(+)
MTLLVLLCTVLLSTSLADITCPGTNFPDAPTSQTPLSRWPYVTGSTPTSVVVQWGTTASVKGSGVVTATPLAGGTPVTSPAATPEKLMWYNWADTPLYKTMYQFRLTLAGLQPATTYCYSVTVGETELISGGSFRTADLPAATQPLNFIAWGDMGIGTEQKPWVTTSNPEWKVRDGMVQSGLLDDAMFLLALGDDAYFSGKPHEFDQRFFPYFYDLLSNKSLYITTGNHDYVHDMAETYLKYFMQTDSTVPKDHTGRYFSWDYGMVHFVAVDTEWWQYDDPRSSAGSQMLKWLDADLAKAQSGNTSWTVIMQHKMPWTQSEIADVNVTTYLLPMYEKYHIPLVLGGHWHNYQRYPPIKDGVVTNTTDGGVTYIISGGGGYQIGSRSAGYKVPDPIASTPERTKYTWVEEGVEGPLGLGAAPAAPTVFEAKYHFLSIQVPDKCNMVIKAVDEKAQQFDELKLEQC